MTTVNLILASSSPYRRQLLDRLGLPYQSIKPDVDETPLPGESPARLCARLARLKAESLRDRYPEAVIIGCDQICDLDGAAIGKPHDADRAIEQLTRMQGRRVIFHTALCVISPTIPAQETMSDTVLTMRPLSRETIVEYIDRDRPFDCAGSAKIECLGVSLVRSFVSDDPTSLIGLPLIALTSMLTAAGVPPLAGLSA